MIFNNIIVLDIKFTFYFFTHLNIFVPKILDFLYKTIIDLNLAQLLPWPQLHRQSFKFWIHITKHLINFSVYINTCHRAFPKKIL